MHEGLVKVAFHRGVEANGRRGTRRFAVVMLLCKCVI